MNDDFEQRLREQKLRPMPCGWRQEILQTAHHAASAHHAALITQHAFFSILRRQFSSLLWPNPRAWAGLAAIWLVILTMNFATRDNASTAPARAETRPSPETLLMLKEQRQLLAELNGSSERSDADQPKPALPQPRSQRREEMLVV